MDDLRGDARERLFPKGTIDEANLTPDGSDPLRYGLVMELCDFADSIDRRQKPEVDGYEGWKDVALGHRHSGILLREISCRRGGRGVGEGGALLGGDRQAPGTMEASLSSGGPEGSLLQRRIYPGLSHPVPV